MARNTEDQDIQDANARAVAEIEREVAGEQEEPKEVQRGKEIDVDEEDDEEPSREPTEERESRSEKRRARAARYRDLAQQNEELRRSFQERDRELSELRGLIQGLQSSSKPAAPEQPQKSLEELAVEQAERAVYDIHAEFSALPAHEQAARLTEYQRKHSEAERKKNEAQYRYFASKNQPTQQQQAPNPVEMYLTAQAPDVVSTPRGKAAINTQFQRLVMVKGEPDNWATLNKAIELAREDLGMRRQAPAINRREPGLRQKLTAPIQGAQGGGGDNGKRVVRMGGGGAEEKARRQMAQGMYPNLPPEKAYEKFAKTVLKKQLEDGEIES